MRRRNGLLRVLVAITVGVLAGHAPAATGTGEIKLDHRGLLDFGKGRTANLIAFGPGWKYAAQDYALKNIAKTGSGADLRYESDFHIPGAQVRLTQTSKPIEEGGKKGLKLEYVLSRDDPFSLESAYVAIRVPVDHFIHGTVEADGKAYAFPEKFDKEYLPFPRQASSIVLTSEEGLLTIKGERLQVARVDMRKHKAEIFEVRIAFAGTKDTKRTSVSFEVFAADKPWEAKADGDWTPLPVGWGTEPGSILDFSFMSDPPAGKYGRVVPSPAGHLVYADRPDTRVRLMGTNLCFSANYLPNEAADELAETFRRMGYNAVRLHHTDVDLMHGAWNAKQSDDIDAARLDRLDYLFAAMKNAGMYVSIDLFTMRRFGADEIEGWDEYVNNPNVIKALVPILPSAFDAWSKMALKWMNHVNPYTGLAWKDDPALLSICPVNEDSIASVWATTPRVKQLYLDRFEQWKAENDRSGDEKQLLAEFLTQVKMASNRQMAEFFEKHGVRAMISGSNWWDTMAQTFTRSQFDVVDNHQYWDHPWPHYLPNRYNQRSNLKESASYILPVLMTPTRVFGKPFTCTEYNFCAPNQYRAEAGASVGAYSALQDWDALFRFAWSHSAERVSEQQSITGFDIVTDPIALLTERQVALLFGRGDVKPAEKRYVYAVTMDEATKPGVGNMWSKGLFPRQFTVMGLVSQVGSQVTEGGKPIEGEFDAVVAAKQPAPAVLGGRPYLAPDALPKLPNAGEEIVSDTRQIALNQKGGYLKVATPRSECLVVPGGVDLEAEQLSVTGNTTFASISASAMDGRDLAASQRVLVLHITNVLNTNMQFANKTMTMLTGRGELPYLARTGSASLRLKNANPNLTLYALDFAGRRLREVPAAYAEGAYRFTVAIEPGSEQPTMLYELAPR